LYRLALDTVFLQHHGQKSRMTGQVRVPHRQLESVCYGSPLQKHTILTFAVPHSSYKGYRSLKAFPVAQVSRAGRINKARQQKNENDSRIKYFDPGTNSWMLEKMEYQVYLGSSSNEGDLLKDSFRVD
jgi:hypothetical protein